MGVSGGIANDVCFGFNNTAVDDTFAQFAHQHFSDKKARERIGVGRQLGARETTVNGQGQLKRHSPSCTSWPSARFTNSTESMAASSWARN